MGLNLHDPAFVGVTGTPAEFSPNSISSLERWYDASVGITKDGDDLVSVWLTQDEGTAKRIRQTGSGDQPKWYSEAQNGHDIVDFGNQTSNMGTFDDTVEISQPLTTFAVIEFPPNDGNNHYLNSSRNGGANEQSSFVKSSGANAWEIQAGATLTASASVTETWGYMCCLFSGSDSYIRINGVEIAQGDAGSTLHNPMTLGATYANTNHWSSGVMHYGICSDELSSGDLASLESWMADQAGL